MRWTAGLILLAVTMGCSGSEVASPIGPSPVDAIDPAATPGSSGASQAGGRGVIRVPDDYPTIQAAVDATRPGDKIQVGSGVYCERVVIRKPNPQLRTSPGANRAIITGACPKDPDARPRVGIHVIDAQGLEIMGFIVEHFEYGIVLQGTTGSRVHLNEARHNVPGGTPDAARPVRAQPGTCTAAAWQRSPTRQGLRP